jgi:hypothetical protein
MSIYHERQVGNYCRCHALNNLMGKKLLELSKFDEYCVKYDTKNKFCKNCSKSQMFYNYGGNNNIFGFCLEQCKQNIVMVHHDFYKIKNVNITKCISNKKFIGFILYNNHHTWCGKNINGTIYIIDSMRNNIQKINNSNILNRRGLGVIEIYYT